MVGSEYALVGKEIGQLEDAAARLGLLGNCSQEFFEIMRANEVVVASQERPIPDSSLRENALLELECLASLEDSVPTPDWAPPLSPHAYATLLGTVAVFHAALPFAEPERRWFYGTVREIRRNYGSIPDTEQLAKLAKRTTTLVALGLRQTVSGDDLLNRWCDWRTDSGPYQGHGTFQVACGALRQIVGLIPPDGSHT